MKKFLFIIISAILVLASCAKNEVVVSGKQKAINFSTYLGKTPALKGVDNVSTLGKNFGLIIIESATPEDDWELSDGHIGSLDFIGLSVSGSDGDGDGLASATPEYPLYWPLDPTQELQFYSMHPVPDPVFIGSNGINPYTLVIRQSIYEQSDYIFARAKASYNSVGGGAVSLDFRHLLSKLNITATRSLALQAEGAESVVVTKLVLGSNEINFHDKAQFNPAEDLAGNEPYTITVPDGAALLAPWTLTGEFTVGDSDATLLTNESNGGNIFVAPEDFSGDSAFPVHIEYTVKYADKDVRYLKDTKITMDLTGAHAYVINLELPVEKREITFSVIDDTMNWTENGVNG